KHRPEKLTARRNVYNYFPHQNKMPFSRLTERHYASAGVFLCLDRRDRLAFLPNAGRIARCAFCPPQ
ncbi:hypothetical protein QCE47_09415, partial [Caballeronia sp. LZ025]|uniref:hypothetical protein n=1 Tax=Caballeronia sp. LZ025 TaxID=3038562 RepID=UPI0028636A5A